MGPLGFWECRTKVKSEGLPGTTSLPLEGKRSAPSWGSCGSVGTNHASGPHLLGSSWMEEMKLEIPAGWREGCQQVLNKAILFPPLSIGLNKMLLLPEMTAWAELALWKSHPRQQL